jgi:cell division protein FtsB
MKTYIAIFLWLFSFYLLFNSIFAKNGILDLFDLKQKNLDLLASLKSIQDENKNTEIEINLLSDKHLNRDYLEEVAKSDLNYSAENEYLVLIK